MRRNGGDGVSRPSLKVPECGFKEKKGQASFQSIRYKRGVTDGKRWGQEWKLNGEHEWKCGQWWNSVWEKIRKIGVKHEAEGGQW